MSALTKLARGRDCTIRLPCCNFNTETTVAAHYRSVRLGAGTSHRPNDLIAAFACSACHDEVDGRTHLYPREVGRFAHTEGCLETWLVLLDIGFVRVGKR